MVKKEPRLFHACRGGVLVLIDGPADELEFQVSGDTFDERWVFAGPCLDDRASRHAPLSRWGDFFIVVLRRRPDGAVIGEGR